MTFLVAGVERLTGFYLSNKKSYFGTDPNLNMFEIYKKMCLQYEKWLGNANPKIVRKKNCFRSQRIKNVRIYNLPAEDLNYQEIPDIRTYIFFTTIFQQRTLRKRFKGRRKSIPNRYKTGEAWKIFSTALWVNCYQNQKQQWTTSRILALTRIVCSSVIRWSIAI